MWDFVTTVHRSCAYFKEPEISPLNILEQFYSAHSETKIRNAKY